MRRRRLRAVLGSTAILSAVGFSFSWLCCVLPIALLGSTGLAAAGLGTQLEPLRPHLQAVSLLALGLAFYTAYRRRGEEACEEEEACPSPRRGRVAVWIFAVLVLLLLTSPYWAGYLALLSL